MHYSSVVLIENKEQFNFSYPRSLEATLLVLIIY